MTSIDKLHFHNVVITITASGMESSRKDRRGFATREKAQEHYYEVLFNKGYEFDCIESCSNKRCKVHG